MVKLQIKVWLVAEPIEFLVSEGSTVGLAALSFAKMLGLDTRGSSWGMQGPDEVPIDPETKIGDLEDRDLELIQDAGGV